MSAAADDVVDIDQARTADIIERLTQQRFAVFNRTAAQIPRVQMQQIEREINEPIRASPGDRIVKVADMGDAAVIRHGDFAVEHDFAAAG